MQSANTGIYEIVNLVNGRLYVGSAQSLKKRWREHRRQLDEGRHHSRFLQRAWCKYGPTAFAFRKLVICARANLIMYEQACIDALKPDYNCAPTAGSQLGYRHTEETRAKLVESHIGKPSPRKGVRLSATTRAKISSSKRGKTRGPHSAETRAKIGAAHNSLTAEQIRRGRLLRSSGVTVKEIAKDLGCSMWTAYDFLSGRTYEWVN